ncbi:hypothetical protein P879_10341 [Paragonimus westermani]|uniref:Uncharacterized protein n=1 Tax=Paragonimus westermani TaxID=34504 RepID=A0A8T0DBU8_9TREM|nr:hypothetical protein P879_10341 [Paragonimus westermani]
MFLLAANHVASSDFSMVTQPTAVAGILFDMPILPVSLTRVGPSPTQSSQQQTHPHLRPVLHHSGSTLGGTPYTVVSSSSGASLGPGGSSLTILFGPSLERSSSAATYTSSSTTSTTTSSSEVRALTAAAAAAALAGSHSRSFAGLVHSLSSMVAASSAPVDASSARTISTATEVGVNPMVCTTSTSTSTVSPVSTVANLSHSGGRAVSSVTSSTGFTPSTTAAQATGGSNYGLLDHRTLFKETHAVQSITMSRSGQRALITIHKMGLHLWDVECCAIVQRFIGYKQDTFRLHSTFGGANENFVATGSENGRIHIWHTSGGNHPIHSALSPSSSSSNGSAGGGHDAVTCVHWNPVLTTMMASVNDAGEVCIWGPQRYVFGAGQPMEESS